MMASIGRGRRPRRRLPWRLIGLEDRITPSLSGVSYQDADADGHRDAGELGYVGRVVYVDSNNNGRFDTGMPHTFTSPHLPQAILGNATVSVPIPVSLGGTVAEVEVALTISHPFVEDLDVYLVHPGGQRVELVTDATNGGVNFSGTVFDDHAATAINAGMAPYAGRFRPEGLLSDFYGLPLAGTWFLEVTDDFAADDGVLNSVTLMLGRAFPNIVAMPIPDTGTPAKSTTTLSGLIGTVADLEVAVDITHNWDADLDIYLRGPNGVAVELSTDNGGSGDNYFATVFDDEAATPITTGPVPFSGRFRPEGSLATFDGISPNGDWTLEITDDLGGFSGQLNWWTLFVQRDFAPANTKAAVADDGTIINTLQVDGLRGPIQDVEVSVDFTHQWTSDLEVFLTSPLGTKVELFTDVGSTGKNVYGLTLDDDVLPSVRDAATPFKGRFRPEGKLSAFDGESGNGNWTLTVTDDNAGFTGTLDRWSVTFRTAYEFTNSVVTGITDASPAVSLLPVQGVPGPVSDVNVRLNITHGWDADLDVFLTAPGGTQYEVFSDVGGSGDNFTGTVLDDEALGSITLGAAPFTGSFIPEGSLATFDGINPNGFWVLTVVDDTAGFNGTLNNWSLVFTSGERHSVTRFNGSYTIDNMPAGSHRVREQRPAGFQPTEPLPFETYVVSLGAGGSAGGLDFGSHADTTPPTATLIPVSPDPRNSAVNQVQIYFSEPVTGLDISDLYLSRDAGPNLLTPAQAVDTLNYGFTWTLDGLAGLTGAAGLYRFDLPAVLGTLILDRAGNAMISSPLQESWLTDLTAPVVTALDRVDPDPTAGPAVTWRLSSSEPIVGLTPAHFALAPSGLGGSAITSVVYNGTLGTWDITAAIGTGSGTLGLNLVGTASAGDAAGNPIANVPFAGQTYTVLSVNPPPKVASVLINGSNAAQRSMVTSLVVTFDSVVSFTGPPAGAFTLSRTGPGSPTADVTLAASVVDTTATAVTLTFSGGLTEFQSLIDGRYRLTVSASKVGNASGALDGNGDGIAGDNYVLASSGAAGVFRLFGDVDGDADVDAADYGAVRSAFGGPAHPAVDFDGDGDVDAADFGQFRARFGSSLP